MITLITPLLALLLPPASALQLASLGLTHAAEGPHDSQEQQEGNRISRAEHGWR